MRIEKGVKICLDTNVLLDATDEGRSLHEKALNLIESLTESGLTVCLPTQVIREYLVVATRPPQHNGLGLSIIDAVENIGEFQSISTVIPESIEPFAKVTF